jgi:3-oxoacyl-[acyl-carrier protein] reductase
MGRLDGQHALVTGAGSGLGRAIALALVEEGALVAFEDLDSGNAKQALSDSGGQGIALEGDVSDPSTVRGWFERIREEFGGLEILINNAGYVDQRDEVQARMATIMGEVLTGGEQQTALDSTTALSDEAWSRMIAVHLNGTFYCTREALKLMQPARYGRVVSLASIAATTGISAVPHYSAAKGAIISFTKAVAREVVRLGITVNAIAPGYIDTPLLDGVNDLARQALIANIPMGRLGIPDEVVPAALFLVDPRNGFMTGQVVSPNGGEVI